MLELNKILETMRDRGASDTYIKVGSEPVFRVRGELTRLKLPEVTADDTQRFMTELMTERQCQVFERSPDLDLAYTQNGNRFRVNAFREQGQIGFVIRYVFGEDLSFGRLNLPAVVATLAELHRGLVIITGATGSGKSTTIAAMLHHINSNFKKHIVTIEDPVEYVHEDIQSVINQREVGFDTNSFSDALKHVVRQSPDVIFIGEMRDLETMETALSASLTGHLVVTTMHTIDVTQTVERMVHYFPEHQRDQVRLELSLSLEGVICMRLLPRHDGKGRVPALEIMRTTGAIRKALLDGDTWKLLEYMKNGTDLGMQTFNQALLNLAQSGMVNVEEAIHAASNPEEFKLNMKGMFTGIDSFQL